MSNYISRVQLTDNVVAEIKDANAQTSISNINGNIGELSKLTTSDKTKIVNAINSIITERGALSNLTTSDKTKIVNAINSIITERGALSSLTTSNKNKIVDAINSIITERGALSSLTTSNKTKIVNAINSIITERGALSALNTTNKTSIVNAINELASIINRNMKTIKDYGAVGDGVHDDSQAFTDCITNEDCVILPGGTYKINFEGSVQNKVIIGYNAIIKTTSNLHFKNFKNITIRDVEIDGQSTASIPLYFDIGHGANVFNCHVHHGTIICCQFSAVDGVLVDGCVMHDTTDTTNSNTVIAFNVPVGYPSGYENNVNVVTNTECYNGGLDGIIANMHYVNVTNCNLHDNGKRMTAAGIYTNSKYNHIYANNHIWNNTGNGIDVVSSGNIVIDGNYTSNNKGGGVFVGSMHGCIISNNVSNGNGSNGVANVQSAGVGVAASDTVHIDNNLCNLNKYGIMVESGSSNIKLSGNTTLSNTTADLNMLASYQLAEYKTVTV